MEDLDVVIVGGGTAGVAAAQSAVELGARVGLIESNRPGGHSLFRGQLPMQIVRQRLEESGEPVSYEDLIREVDEQIEKTSKRIEQDLRNSGVEFIKGVGALEGNHQVLVSQGGDAHSIKSSKIIIATGSLPNPAGKIPFDDHSIFHIDQILESKKAPASLLIVGGNKTGLEASCLFNLLGTKVFLVDENHRLIHDKDPDLITALEAGFKQQKIKALLGKKIISIFKGTGQIDITLEGGVKFSTESVLVSGERSGNTVSLGLDSVSVEQGAHHEIWVNEQMGTSLKNIFAAGSVTGRPHSLQISREEGRVAGVNAAGGSESVDSDRIPFCLQTQPEIASVGCLPGEAHYKGYRAVLGRHDFSGDKESNNNGGFCKIVADRDSKKFIGAQISGAQASEAMRVLQPELRECVEVKKLTQISETAPLAKPIILAAKECVRALSVRR